MYIAHGQSLQTLRIQSKDSCGEQVEILLSLFQKYPLPSNPVQLSSDYRQHRFNLECNSDPLTSFFITVLSENFQLNDKEFAG
jgi:hypothetical protein